MLQAWALQTYLEKQGHEVEIVNYASKSYAGEAYADVYGAMTDIVDAPEDPEPTLFGPDPRVAERLKRERLSAALDALPSCTR